MYWIRLGSTGGSDLTPLELTLLLLVLLVKQSMLNPPLGDAKAIFGKRESPQAAYDAINAGQGGDRPGGATRHLGKPLHR